MKKYRKRIADEILARKLEGKGAVLIEGPKWCGKTTTAEQIAANTNPYFHALSASTTDFAFSADGQPMEGGAYIALYNSATESFSDAPTLPPQGAGYIELVCAVPANWQKISVTYTPTFVQDKTLTFTISASDLTNA